MRTRKQQVNIPAIAVSIAATGLLCTAAQLQANAFFVITPTAAGVVGTLPNYPNAGAFDVPVKVDPAATNSLSLYGKTLRAGQVEILHWDPINSAWSTSDVEQVIQPRAVPTASGVTANGAGVVSASTATTATVWTIPGTTAASLVDSVAVNSQTLTALSGDVVVTQATPCTFTITDSANVPVVGDSISALFAA